MKKIWCVIAIMLLSMVICSCAHVINEPEEYKPSYDEGYSIGYDEGFESGYEYGKDEMRDTMYDLLYSAAEHVHKAEGMLEDYGESSEITIDDIYGEIEQASSILRDYW